MKAAIEKLPKKLEHSSRFKIPQIVSEVQGQKTLVKNFGDVAQVLRRDQGHLSKYFTKELAAPGNVQNGVLFLQKKVSRENLQKKLESYVKEFVFCKVCGEPDTHLERVERVLQMRCDACGARSPARQI